MINDCEVGRLMLAKSYNKKGFFHNLAKPQERLSQAQMMDITPTGLRLVIARTGGNATMMQRASAR